MRQCCTRREHGVGKGFMQSATRPFFLTYFGREIVGGPLLAVLDTSRQTAAVAVRILGGEKASDIKIPSVKFSRPKFDWREMQRWGISESRLPLRSEIVFRELTAWERYRWQITSILLALFVQSAMITWLQVEQFRRRRAEKRSRKLSLEVMHLSRAAEAGALSASFAHDLPANVGHCTQCPKGGSPTQQGPARTAEDKGSRGRHWPCQ